MLHCYVRIISVPYIQVFSLLVFCLIFVRLRAFPSQLELSRYLFSFCRLHLLCSCNLSLVDTFTAQEGKAGLW